MTETSNRPVPALRCESTHGQYRCVGDPDHPGPHWAPLERSRALRWGMVGIGCFDPECNREPGHEMPHRDGHGRSWVPLTDEELAEYVRTQRTP